MAIRSSRSRARCGASKASIGPSTAARFLARSSAARPAATSSAAVARVTLRRTRGSNSAFIA